MKDYFVSSVASKINVVDNSGPCGGKRPHFDLCKVLKKTSTFKKRNSDQIYHNHKPLNSSSKNTVYLVECNQCWKQYTGSSKTKLRYRVNNYKSTHRKLKNKKQVPKRALKERRFHEYFHSDDQNGTQDWVITLIEQVDDEKFIRQR